MTSATLPLKLDLHSCADSQMYRMREQVQNIKPVTSYPYYVPGPYLDGSRASTTIITTTAIWSSLTAVANSRVLKAMVSKNSNDFISYLFGNTGEDGFKVVLGQQDVTNVLTDCNCLAVAFSTGMELLQGKACQLPIPHHLPTTICIGVP